MSCVPSVLGYESRGSRDGRAHASQQPWGHAKELETISGSGQKPGGQHLFTGALLKATLWGWIDKRLGRLQPGLQLDPGQQAGKRAELCLVSRMDRSSDQWRE